MFPPTAPLRITEVRDAESAVMGLDNGFTRNVDNRRSLPSRFRKQARPALTSDTFVNGSKNGNRQLSPSRALSLSSGEEIHMVYSESLKVESVLIIEGMGDSELDPLVIKCPD